MKNTVETYIQTYNMIKPNDRIIAAVSGGADSVCLLHLLVRLREEYFLRLRAVHVHHGLRGQEADRDAAFTEQLCRTFSVPCTVLFADVKGYAKEHSVSEEEAGRILRYRLLEQEAIAWEMEQEKELDGKPENKAEGGAVKLATAHHGDDSAETILYNLCRGSGLAGLGGIRPVRDRIIRPLLGVSRQEILTYLKEQSLTYCEDSTNQSNDYTRNRMRHIILPAMEAEINPKAGRHICQAGEKIRQAHEFLSNTAKNWIDSHMEGDKGLVPDSLLQEQEIVQSYVLGEVLADTVGSRKDLSSSHVGMLSDLLEGAVGRKADLPGGICAVREYEGVRIEQKSKVLQEGSQEDNSKQNSLCPSLEMTVFSGQGKENQEFPKNQYTKWFDYDKIKNRLSVRTRRTGDYITLKGGGRKSVKAYMIDEKIPAAQRDSIYLLADGNHILWIIGFRISEYYKIGPETTAILQVRVNGGENHGR